MSIVWIIKKQNKKHLFCNFIDKYFTIQMQNRRKFKKMGVVFEEDPHAGTGQGFITNWRVLKLAGRRFQMSEARKKRRRGRESERKRLRLSIWWGEWEQVSRWAGSSGDWDRRERGYYRAEKGKVWWLEEEKHTEYDCLMLLVYILKFISDELFILLYILDISIWLYY